MEPPSQPNPLSPEQAAKEGQALVNEMLSQQPEENAVTGKMSIRPGKKDREKGAGYAEFPIRFQTIVTPTNWVSVYQATRANQVEHITIVHTSGHPNVYYSGPNPFIAAGSIKNPASSLPPPLSDKAILAPFAGSDFSIADLGLEFLHWPDQKLLQKDMKRGRACRVLESTNPHPVPGAYARIKSWVDNESHGIVQAEAYDVRGERVKEFAPKSFSKVNGQWQLEGMEIRNVQTDSTTAVKFDLKE
jgi:hypothetical protein